MLGMQSLTQRLANPSNFMALSARLAPWCWGLAGLLILVGLWLAFFGSPPDYQQGQTVKIMYVHVPAAWLAMLIYALIALSSFGLLVFRHPLADVSAKAAAPIGATFTFLALATGSLWGKPMWGTFWVWDPRLTSVLILFGIAILPVIKFSVEWNSLHQPASVMRLGAPTIHPSLLWPLLVMALGFMALFAALYLKAMRNEILRRRLKSLRKVAATGAGAALSQQAAV